MRNSLLLAHLLAIITLFFTVQAKAALLERLGGLAYYDEDADLTWLADANYSLTSGYAVANAIGAVNSSPSNIQATGAMGWEAANSWAASLNVAGVTGWRLPDTLQPDVSCDNQSGGYSLAYNCTGSEMGNLFYNTLGNSAFSLSNTDPFDNVQSNYYWSSLEYAYNTSQAWGFNMYDGDQGYNNKNISLSAWAVHDGDVSVVPIPAAIWLFGSGLIGLIGLARRKASI